MNTQKQEYWLGEYKKRKKFWVHDENMNRPHVELTSGKHSNGFFNSDWLTEEPVMLKKACDHLVNELNYHIRYNDVDRFAGPKEGAVHLASYMALAMADYFSYEAYKFVPIEKEGSGQNKRMFFKRHVIHTGEKVILADDVITTAGSISLAKGLVETTGGIVVPYVVALVNRSGKTHCVKCKIVSLIDFKLGIYDPGPETCPYCAEGSKAIRPKGENWELLTKDY